MFLSCSQAQAAHYLWSTKAKPQGYSRPYGYAAGRGGPVKVRRLEGRPGGGIGRVEGPEREDGECAVRDVLADERDRCRAGCSGLRALKIRLSQHNMSYQTFW
jgi:hypothetical protein